MRDGPNHCFQSKDRKNKKQIKKGERKIKQNFLTFKT
jgi:hypothetical protein